MLSAAHAEDWTRGLSGWWGTPGPALYEEQGHINSPVHVHVKARALPGLPCAATFPMKSS